MVSRGEKPLLTDYLRVQGIVLAVALVGAGIVIASEFILTSYLHVYYLLSTAVGLALSFEWNVNVNILLKVIRIERR